MKGQGKELEDPAPATKSFPNKFSKPKTSLQMSNNSSVTGLDQIHMSEKDINVSIIVELNHNVYSNWLTSFFHSTLITNQYQSGLILKYKSK